MKIIGLTGSIGCGKSSLSDIFRKHGICIIDADIKGREVYENKEVLENLYKEFGEEIKSSDGRPDRKLLGKIVFSDEKKLEKLNDITHPAIRQMIEDDIKAAENKGEKAVVIDAALLIEAGYTSICDIIIVVTCDEGTQIERVMRRDNCTKETAVPKIKSQMSQTEKKKYADYVIDNSGTIKELENQAEMFIEKFEVDYFGK